MTPTLLIRPESSSTWHFLSWRCDLVSSLSLALAILVLFSHSNPKQYNRQDSASQLMDFPPLHHDSTRTTPHACMASCTCGYTCTIR
jgi:hypothetical protein